MEGEPERPRKPKRAEKVPPWGKTQGGKRRDTAERWDEVAEASR